ncbi:peroxisomal ATPase PEX6 isoform X2 [Panulirus ornatus]|uniref:peroxisomal ATPase PEX6 isoform X2 n=1 Tax=Panulirus ornatus TaxID=150431 RepID=UPI003A8B846E
MGENMVMNMWSHLQMLLYTCILIKAIRPHIVNPLVFAAKQAKCSQSRRRIKVRRISMKTLHYRVVKTIGFEPDVNAVVLISEKSAISLGLKCGQWQSVLYHNGNPSKSGMCKDQMENVCRRWIIIVVCSGLGEDHCFVSSILYHNLQGGNDKEVFIEFDDNGITFQSEAIKRILMLWNDGHGSKISSENFESAQIYPDVANEVHIQIVESTKYKCGNELESLLRDYFRIPKLISVKDVLAVPIPTHLGYDFVTSGSIIPPKYVFIKIMGTKVRSDRETQQSVLIEMGVTSLYLTGTTHCHLPLFMEDFDKQGDLDVPPILEKTFVRLKNVLQMEMQQRRHMQWNSNGSIQHSSKTVHLKSSRKHKDKCSVLNDIKHFENDAYRRKEKNSEVCTHEEQSNVDNATILLLGPPGCGNEQVIKFAASALGLGVLWTNSWQLKGDTSGGTEARLRQTFVRATSQGPCVLALLNVHCIAKDRDGSDDARVVAALREEAARLSQLEPHVFLVATAPDRTSVSGDLWSVWSYQESAEVSDLHQRSIMLDWLLSKWLTALQTQTLAQRTAGYVLGDFQALLNAANRHCLCRMTAKKDSQVAGDSENNMNTDKRALPLVYNDLLKALGELQANRSEALGAPRIPQVRWTEVGGLEDAKRQVVNTIQLPLHYPAFVSNRLRRSGVLLYGPPGTGKTLLAKAVATECGLNFMSVKGPELLNMYVGQSEENVRQVFRRAQAAAPCVIFFDELDSLAPNRGQSGDSGGVMDRIVSALLAELDGVASSADVFVLAATNRPDLIDPALLRPGRLPLGSSVSLEQIADLLPLTLTGADLCALCTDALYKALHRTTSQILAGVVKEEDAVIVVEEKDFHIAAEKLVPSVTPRELAHYRALDTASQLVISYLLISHYY